MFAAQQTVPEDLKLADDSWNTIANVFCHVRATRTRLFIDGRVTLLIP